MKMTVFLSRIVVLIYLFFAVSVFADSSGNGKIESFLKKVIANEIKEDYRGKGADVSVEVTNLQISKLDKKRKHEQSAYFAEGQVTYKMILNTHWVNMNGESFKKGRVDYLSRRFKGGLLESAHGGLKQDASNGISVYEETPCP
jgi:hypothetical protein